MTWQSVRLSGSSVVSRSSSAFISPRPLKRVIVQPAFAGGADGGQQTAEVLDAGGLFAAAERVARDLAAGALLADEVLDVEAELFKLLERTLDRADFVQLDDV